MRFQRALPIFAILAFVASDAFCQDYYYPRRPRSEGLGIVGGLAGAGVGALIGEDNGDAVPGALIGGAVGALSGAVIGDAIDQDEANARTKRMLARTLELVSSVRSRLPMRSPWAMWSRCPRRVSAKM
jgi:uncharacterized protein YcfJ